MKNDFIPRDDQELYNWLEQYRKELLKNAYTLGLEQKLNGSVAASSTVNIQRISCTKEVWCIVRNTGSAALWLSLSTAADTGNNAEGVLINPAELEKTVMLQSISAIAAEQYLNISNMDATLSGSYEVILPGEQVLLANGSIVELQQQIEEVTLTRNSWKQAAEKKNSTKKKVLSDILRPLIRNKIKVSDAYSVGMGKDMGIVTEMTAVDKVALKPVIKVKMSGGTVTIQWIKGKTDALRLETDRSDGKGFVLLTISMKANYTDKTALPSVPAVWRYRAVYVINDEMAGQWSNEVSVVVVNRI